MANEKNKEALAIVKQMVANGDIVQDVAEKYFPELAESEDERIRKELIEFFTIEHWDGDAPFSAESAKERIAWLEKQRKNNMGISESTKQKLEDSFNKALEKETPESWNEFLDKQKPTDKVEPKFSAGDWVIDEQGIIDQITDVIENVTNHTYGYDTLNGEYFNDYMEGVRLWTIQDAKDGDVLAYNDGSLAIFRYRLSGLDAGLYMSHVILVDKIELKQTCAINNVHPATKEQRDLLFQKMREAGYEWDAEKKELKKIEQKPAWSEEDEKMIQDIINDIAIAQEQVYCKSRCEDEINWLKSLKDRYAWKPSEEQMKALTFACIKNANIDKPSIKALYDLKEQLKKLKA